MAEIVTSILRIASILCTCNGNNTWYLCDLQENKDALVTAMDELKDTRVDVQKQVVEAENNPNEPMECKTEVSGWLKRVQAIEDEVMKVILKADKEIKGRCIGGYCSINCWNRYEIGKLVTQRLAIVKDLKTKGSFVSVAHKLSPPLVQIEPVYSIVGMESMFDKVWRLLAEDEVRIMGLYGYGGVGKTTLLKQINNEFLKTTTTTTSCSSSSNLHGFDVVIFVVVSKVINIYAIQKEIGSRLGLSSPDRRSIFNTLTKKNFVLLLDDLWERVDLQSIGIPPRLENKKSKVVFTTRSEIVCGHMDANKKFRVECLPWDEAWTLFQEKVGNEALNSHPKIPELAKDVARECGGLPLTLITIGRVMSTKRSLQEWEHAIAIATSSKKFPGMDKEILPLLKLRYDNLGDDMIKSCFLFCALYPEDHSIDKSKLIDYWIGEGLISLSEFNNLDDARNKGYDVIEDLKGACLLESDGRREETEVKMNAMIRNLALWIAHDCGNKRDKMIIIKTSERSSSWYNNAERIYFILPPVDDETKVRPPPPPPLKSHNLITLIHRHSLDGFVQSGLSVVPQNFFEFTPLLRVLDFSNTKMETFPMSITELLELRYLSLSSPRIKELPEELGKLVKLNFLDLSLMVQLKKIPSGVIGGSLLELRVLNLYRCYRVVWDFDEVYKLKHLNEFGISINTEHNLNKLLSNQNLQMCTRHPNLERIPEANMGIQQQQQQHLGSSSCFQNLHNISILYCNGLKDLTWVGYVPNLKKLDVSHCEELEELIIVVIDDLGGSKGGGGGDVFKSLETLSLYKLPKLKSICRNALAFPCLKVLEVGKCPQLKKLPFDSGSNANNTLQVEWIPEANMGIQQQQQQHLGSSSCFQNLHNISILYCNGLKDLTWVGYVPNLKKLDVSHCEELEEIIIVVIDDLGGGSKEVGGGGNEIIFKSLKNLHLRSLPKLKSICRNAALAFPCLESFVVSQCRQLKKLPFDSGSYVNNTLRRIAGGPKWWSELHWEEEEDHNNNNNNNELLKSKFLPYFDEVSYYD